MQLYLERAWTDHLSNNKIYQRLSFAECNRQVALLTRLYKSFLDRFFPPKSDDRTFLLQSFEQNEWQLPYFYLIAKIHKTPWTTRPIISTCGSHVEGLGRWADRQLRAIIKELPYVATSSPDVLQQLQALSPLPDGARFFTANAQSMYTNIDTTHALEVIVTYLRSKPLLCRVAKVDPDAIHVALRILMRHNVFTFGNTCWLQQTGTAMGTAVGPAYATMYYAVHEQTLGCRDLCFYTRYIDNVLGIWVPGGLFDNANWTGFQNRMNSFRQLKWDFSKRSTTATYLDMELSIVAGRVHSRCVEKKLNLHLHLPLHSAHPRGLLRALIRGTVLRISCITTDPIDRLDFLQKYRQQLRQCRFSPSTLDPLFQQEFPAVLAPIPDTARKAKNDKEAAKSLFFHVMYHPLDTPRSVIQQAFRNTMASPPSRPLLESIPNHKRVPFDVRRLVVAYHLPRNIQSAIARPRATGNGAAVSDVFSRLADFDTVDDSSASNPNPVPPSNS
jgi:hypothetical protein